MTKNELLNEIAQQLRAGAITAAEVTALLAKPSDAPEVRTKAVSSLLYYFGAGIVLMGFIIYVSQQWDVLSTITRIAATLLAGIGFLVSANLLYTKQDMLGVAGGLHVVAGFLVPTGIFVTLHELFPGDSLWVPGLIFLLLTLAYMLLYRMQRSEVVFLFSVLYGATATILLTDAMLYAAPVVQLADYEAYRALLLGVSLLSLSTVFTQFRFFGIAAQLIGGIAVYAAALYLGGWQPEQSVFWELAYPLLIVLGGMFAIREQSRLVLILSAFATIGYIAKITGEYFSDSPSWPLMLVLAGGLLMGVGWFTVWLSRKYITKGEQLS